MSGYEIKSRCGIRVNGIRKAKRADAGCGYRDAKSLKSSNGIRVSRCEKQGERKSRDEEREGYTVRGYTCGQSQSINQGAV